MAQVLHQAVGHHEAEPGASRQPVQELFRGAGLPGKTWVKGIYYAFLPSIPLPTSTECS